MLKIPSISTSTAHWERATIIPAGGTGTGHATNDGIKGGSSSALSEMLYAYDVGEDPPYLTCEAIKNKRFYELLCHNLELPAYMGLSENLTTKDLDEIVDRIREELEYHDCPEVFVITSGTDAMEQVAKYVNDKLGDLIRAKGVKVILTGANRDLTKPDTDIWDNLEFAFESGFREDIISGVYVAFHNRLIPAELVAKEPFNGIEMNYISKKDPKYWSAVLKSNLSDINIIRKLWWKLGIRDKAARSVATYPVNVIRENHKFVRGYVNSNSIRAVLFTLYHSSTANTIDDDNVSVAKLVSDFEDDGVLTFAVTENGEPVNLTPTAYETSVKLGKAGLRGLNMTRNVALAKLWMTACGSNNQIVERMQTDFVGEMGPKHFV